MDRIHPNVEQPSVAECAQCKSFVSHMKGVGGGGRWVKEKRRTICKAAISESNDVSFMISTVAVWEAGLVKC